MQRSDAILESLDRAISLTYNLQHELMENGDLSVLEQLYEERGSVLEGLQAVRSSLPNETEFMKQWNKSTAQLVEADRELLAVLGVIKDTYQEKVRHSNQQKYLLIYSKGQRHGY